MDIMAGASAVLASVIEPATIKCTLNAAKHKILVYLYSDHIDRSYIQHYESSV